MARHNGRHVRGLEPGSGALSRPGPASDDDPDDGARAETVVGAEIGPDPRDAASVPGTESSADPFPVGVALAPPPALTSVTPFFQRDLTPAELVADDVRHSGLVRVVERPAEVDAAVDVAMGVSVEVDAETGAVVEARVETHIETHIETHTETRRETDVDADVRVVTAITGTDARDEGDPAGSVSGVASGTTLVASTVPGAVPGTSSVARVVVPAPPLAVSPQRHRAWRWTVGVLVLVVVVLVALVLVQLGRTVPAPDVHRVLDRSSPVPGIAPTLPWPTTGEAAVAVPSLGVALQSGPETPVPIASLAKIMTAYLTLKDHPLAPGAQGPSVAMTATDEAEAISDEEVGATDVPVQPGEHLTERQLLEGLMVHSANNLADALARWDAGTVAAFVADMNATASALGMTHTHYADSNGLSPATTGTPGDQMRLAQVAMAIPSFAQVVAEPSVTLPIAGTLPNYVSSVGTDGVVGIKSGFTQAALGCLVMAAERSVGGHTVLVLAAVTGQPGLDPLSAANQVDLRLVDALGAALRVVPVMSAGTRVATVTVPWTRRAVPVVTATGASLVVWPGTVVRTTMTGGSVRAGAAPGTIVGMVTVRAGGERVQVPARLAGSIQVAPVSWRLART
ncbi:MAG: hypothetical protein ABSG81_10525 [Acidimicrobiales bacterium]